MTRSLDPLNHYQAHFRREALPDDGLWLREHPTLIYYFASPSTDLNTCGVYKKGADRNLTAAYLRTSLHQFLYEMQTQLHDHGRNAGCLCFGVRILRTSPLTGCAFYRNPNQFIFNLAWVNIPTFLVSTDSLVMAKIKITKGLELMLLATHGDQPHFRREPPSGPEDPLRVHRGNNS